MDQRRFEVLGVGILFASSGVVVLLATRDAGLVWTLLGIGLAFTGFACAVVSLVGLPAAVRGWRPGRDARGREPDEADEGEAR